MSVHERLPSADVIFTPVTDNGRVRSITQYREKLFIGRTWLASGPADENGCILSSAPDAVEFEYVHDIRLKRGAEKNPPNFTGQQEPETGCLALAVFNGKPGGDEMLFASLFLPESSHLLVTRDGERFDEVSPVADGAVVHAMIEFDGRLFASVAGVAPGPAIYCSDDPAAGDWKLACEPGFGDKANVSITSLAVFHDHLYAATFNPYNGFQLWCAPAGTDEPCQWQQVITGGGLRYTSSPAVASMAVFNDALYIGTGSPGENYATYFNLDIAAAELIQLSSDNHWEIIAGSPRFSPQGLKVPMAAMGPGFDDASNVAVAALAVHDGRLYAGTCADDYLQKSGSGSFDLWSTADGEEWSPVAVTESARPSGITAACSTSKALLLATANGDCTMPFVLLNPNPQRSGQGHEVSAFRKMARTLLRRQQG